MASALGNFDQPLQLLGVDARFNLKFYINCFDVPFFIRVRAYRRAPERDFARPRRHPQRHQQAPAERAQERRHRIGRDIVLGGKRPSERSVLDRGLQRIID